MNVTIEKRLTMMFPSGKFKKNIKVLTFANFYSNAQDSTVSPSRAAMNSTNEEFSSPS